MPAAFPFYVIPKEHYPAFRKTIGPDLADSYDEWLKVHNDQIEQARRNGDTIILIEINHDEFMAFCRATGGAPDHKTLLAFTVKKASGNQ